MKTHDAIILMGPSGCGKSTIGNALTECTAWPFFEGDNFHPAANIMKMAAGIALEDTDRIVWIDALIAAMDSNSAPRIIVACSALTPYVQQRLSNESNRAVHFVLLQLTHEELKARLATRRGHFMASSLLDSQLATLTQPEHAIAAKANQPVADIVADILAALGE